MNAKSLDNVNEQRSVVVGSLQDLIFNGGMTKVGSQLRRAASSPEIRTESPTFHHVVAKTDPSPVPTYHETAELDGADVCISTSLELDYRYLLIEALDLAVDWRIKAVCESPLRGTLARHFQSSPELRLLSPVYGGLNTVPCVSEEVPSKPTRRSLWKRSKKCLWKSLVNVARRICFYQSFVDVE